MGKQLEINVQVNCYHVIMPWYYYTSCKRSIIQREVSDAFVQTLQSITYASSNYI